MRKITKHIIHCSDSTFGDVNVVRLWHLARGFKDVGYHFIIRQDGEIELGRPLEEQGAHCAGHNRFSIGTCLIGKKGRFTPAQFSALRKLDKTLKMLFPNLQVYPHKHFNEHKTCPEFDVRMVLDSKEGIGR